MTKTLGTFVRRREYFFKVCLVLVILISAQDIFTQSGGQFAVESSVVSGGGGNIAGGDFDLTGTVAQPVAGGYISSVPFHLYSGFWSPFLQPTAAPVSLGGRVRTTGGRGLGGVRITLVGIDGNLTRAVSSPFGYYRFDGLISGNTYILTVDQSRHAFDVPSIAVHLTDTIADLDFIAQFP